jgi:phenylalanyl-tRNA synthetase beta chain
VLIESAHFEPKRVRLGARRHGLRTEASYRFERGVDRDGIVRAADRAARLMAELAGGSVAPGAVEARGDAPAVTEEVRLEVERANRLLGTEIDAAEMASLLERAGIATGLSSAGVLHGRIPSHRNDLHIHQDLTEEVARLYGYDRIPTTMPSAVLAPAESPPSQTMAWTARDALVGCGLLETVSFPFVASGEMAGLRLPEGDPLARTVEVVNPIKEDEPRLRSLLAPTLLRLVLQNLSRQADQVRIFEVSRVFRPAAGEALPDEPLLAGVALAEADPALPWGKSPAPLFFQAKGIAERLLNRLGYVAALQRTGVPPYLHPGASAVIEVGGQVIGSVGELHPETAAHFEIEVPCALAEVNLSRLAALPTEPPRFREVSRFPQSRRDLAVLLGREHAAGDVRDAIQKAAGADCVSTELFDRYEGKGVPEGKVSLAFRLVFQRSDRTLKDAEVTKAVDRVVRMLAHRFDGELR